LRRLWGSHHGRLSRGPRADRRDGLRLDWPEPMGPCPCEQHRADRPGDRRGGPKADSAPRRWPARSAALLSPGGRRGPHDVAELSTAPRPPRSSTSMGRCWRRRPPTFFARILRRRGLIKRSFILRALHHGLQHRFGRLDYGRLLTFGLESIARIPVVELERIAYDNFVEFVRPRLYEGVVEQPDEPPSRRHPGGPRVIVPGPSSSNRSASTSAVRTRSRPRLSSSVGGLIGIGDGPPCYGEGKRFWADRWAAGAGKSRWTISVAYADNWSDRALLERGTHRGLSCILTASCSGSPEFRGWFIARPRRAPRLQGGDASGG